MSRRAHRLHPLSLLLVTVLLAVGSVACGGAPADDEASIERELDERGTLEVMEEIEKAEYTPPEDGKLTEAQIEMFLAVKKRERKIQQVAAKKLEERDAEREAEGKEMGFFEALSAMGDVGDLVTAGPRAAVELGHNPKEFGWVQQKIFEVYADERAREASEAFGKMSDTFVKALEEQRDQTEDPEQRARIEEQIEEMRAQEGEMGLEQERSPGFEHNARLVAENREAIEQAMLEQDKALLGVEEGAKDG